MLVFTKESLKGQIMKIKLKFYKKTDSIILKKNYNSSLQGLVYNLLDKKSAKWLHDKGFKYEKRSFKLFCYSDILNKGKFNREKGIFIFPNTISIIISSPITELLEEIVKNSTIQEEFYLQNNKIYLLGIEIIEEKKILNNRIRINTLSPIEVHSTLMKKDGEKMTYYYKHYDKDFSTLINENLKKKWVSIYGRDCPYDIKIKPVRERYIKKRVINYKGTIIEGMKGHFWLEGDKDFLFFALSASLGSSNSKGFGCIELVK